MKEFIKIYNLHRDKFGFTMSIYNSSITDWELKIGYKCTMKNYGETILDIQSCDVELLFAKAQVELKEWLSENNGGY